MIFTNPTWIFLTVSGIVESSGVTAFTMFLPKVMQFQYSQTMVMAAIWAGNRNFYNDTKYKPIKYQTP